MGHFLHVHIALVLRYIPIVGQAIDLFQGRFVLPLTGNLWGRCHGPERQTMFRFHDDMVSGMQDKMAHIKIVYFPLLPETDPYDFTHIFKPSFIDAILQGKATQNLSMRTSK
jgi:hypothetical protein